MRNSAGLLVMLVTVSRGVAQFCDGRKDGAVCYGTLAGDTFLQLNDGNYFRYIRWWKTTNYKNITTTKQFIIPTGQIRTRKSDLSKIKHIFYPTRGILWIKNLSRADSGSYSFSFLARNGNAGIQTLWLYVEAPITSVHLASECLSQGEQLVSCLVSEGADSVEYSWTLNQQLLEDMELLSGHVQANTIVLKQHVSGWLICYARNHISSHLKGVYISTCGFVFVNCSSNGILTSEWRPVNYSMCHGPIHTVTSYQSLVLNIRNSFLAVIILLMTGMVIFYTLKKKANKTHEVEKDQEIMYVNVPREILVDARER
ncbi:uncharacterized protein LOC109518751 [Hippocampus comes]|uniref:uncharacterized protein LOC109518751 n=1 Tax=Hippocampus comes TaxID=109280 RepID=UPI00094EFB75|nr:PREDICTED: uncharacterized protein LOC109518751 [Hippocampus comes]